MAIVVSAIAIFNMLLLREYYDARDVFLSTKYEAETLELWPKGVQADRVVFPGVVDEDGMQGTNEAQGDGVVNNTTVGLFDRATAIIETWREHPTVSLLRITDLENGTSNTDPSQYTWFQDPQSDHNPDIVYRPRTGRKYKVKRIRSQDSVMMSVIAVDTRNIRVGRGTVTG